MQSNWPWCAMVQNGLNTFIADSRIMKLNHNDLSHAGYEKPLSLWNLLDSDSWSYYRRSPTKNPGIKKVTTGRARTMPLRRRSLAVNPKVMKYFAMSSWYDEQVLLVAPVFSYIFLMFDRHLNHNFEKTVGFWPISSGFWRSSFGRNPPVRQRPAAVGTCRESWRMVDALVNTDIAC